MTRRFVNRGRRRRARPPGGPRSRVVFDPFGRISLFEFVRELALRRLFRIQLPRSGDNPFRLNQAQPVAVPPAPTPATVPRVPPQIGNVPVGPASNDPVFRIGKGKIFGQVLGRAAAPLAVILMANDIRLMAAELDRKRREFERQNAAEIERRRLGRQQPIPEIEFPAPGTLPGQSPARRVEIPEIRPAPSPEIQPLPVEIPGFSIPFPITVPQISPVTPARPTRPSRQPAAKPATIPASPFLPASFPVREPIGRPARLPFSQGQPAPGSLADLTGFDLGFVESTQPQANPQTQSDKCQIVKRRRRKKGKCREGFFRENPTGTKFVTWRTRDCVTGKVVSEGDAPKFGDRSIDNVIDILGG